MKKPKPYHSTCRGEGESGCLLGLVILFVVFGVIPWLMDWSQAHWTAIVWWTHLALYGVVALLAIRAVRALFGWLFRRKPAAPPPKPVELKSNSATASADTPAPKPSAPQPTPPPAVPTRPRRMEDILNQYDE